jgi:AraC-like DNA-binding protein/ligand-binding sensor protein
MNIAEHETGMRLSFDDLTGVHDDAPAMRLDEHHLYHTCKFCLFAKSTHTGMEDCVRNKLAVNKLVLHRKAGLQGFCHLGLFGLAEPLIVEGRILGIFFFDSVVVQGQEKFTRKKVEHYCDRRRKDTAPFLKELKNVPTIDPAKIPIYRESLKTVAALATFLCESGGIQANAYKIKPLRLPYLSERDLPYVIKESLTYIHAHLQDPFNVKHLAAHLRCHPDFLSRKFKKCVGMDLSNYLRHARIDRAKILLENPKLSIDDVAERTGFSDRVNFSKVFHRLAGMPPGLYKSRYRSPSSTSLDFTVLPPSVFPKRKNKKQA